MTRLPIDRVRAIHNLGVAWAIVYDAFDGNRHEIDVDKMYIQRMFEDGDFDPKDTS